MEKDIQKEFQNVKEMNMVIMLMLVFVSIGVISIKVAK